MSQENNSATNETETKSVLGAIKDGFFFGLFGSPVRKDIAGKDDKGNDVIIEKDKIVDVVYAAAGTNNKSKVGKVSNIEIPFPATDEAAMLAAKDCSTTVYRLVDGKYVEEKLEGLRAAVTVALKLRREEAIRGRDRAGNIANEAELRALCASVYGFQLPDATAPQVAEADVAAIVTKAIAEGADVGAAVAAFMRASGIKVA